MAEYVLKLHADRYTYNVYEDRCPTRLVLERLADKWALLILDRLETGPQRFNALKREIRQITQKVLTQTLRKLERDGLIARTVHATKPITVEYALTALGATLTETVGALAHWAEKNMDAVAAAQAAYDAEEARQEALQKHVHRLKSI
ncbi:helix-turn-helix transcriptional regulator [Acidovorax sp. NCPPB 2350]|nr:helix-turn-helix transcriptional regulator [Acidovorax sp. NCPPB 2350]